MAGTPAERGGTPVSGIAPQETAQPQVEYRPFSEFTPEQLAGLAGGEIETKDMYGKPWSDDLRIINYPGWHIVWNADFSFRYPDARRRSIARVKYPKYYDGSLYEFNLDQTVVVTDPNKPGVVTFVDPQRPYPVEENKPTRYDWIRIEDGGGVSIETAIEGSPRVTDEIRQAARIAWGQKVQKKTAQRAA